MILVLEKCFLRKNNVMGIRVVVVEVYRRMFCVVDVRNVLLLMFIKFLKFLCYKLLDINY